MQVKCLPYMLTANWNAKHLYSLAIRVGGAMNDVSRNGEQYCFHFLVLLASV